MAGIKKVKDIVIYKDDRYYSVHPSVERLQNGELMVVFRQAKNRLEESGGEGFAILTRPSE